MQIDWGELKRQENIRKRYTIPIQLSDEEEKESNDRSAHPSTQKRARLEKVISNCNSRIQKDLGFLSVCCGNKNGFLDKQKLERAEACIVCEDTWFTPPQFEDFAGREASKKWKASIYHKGKPLQYWFEEGLLTTSGFNKRPTVEVEQKKSSNHRTVESSEGAKLVPENETCIRHYEPWIDMDSLEESEEEEYVSAEELRQDPKEESRESVSTEELMWDSEEIQEEYVSAEELTRDPKEECDESVSTEELMGDSEEIKVESVSSEELRQDPKEEREESVSNEELRQDLKQESEEEFGSSEELMQDLKEDSQEECVSEEALRQDSEEETQLECVSEEELRQDSEEETQLECVSEEELRQDSEEETQLECVSEEALRQDSEEETQLECVSEEALRQDLKQQSEEEYGSSERLRQNPKEDRKEECVASEGPMKDSEEENQEACVSKEKLMWDSEEMEVESVSTEELMEDPNEETQLEYVPAEELMQDKEGSTDAEDSDDAMADDWVTFLISKDSTLEGFPETELEIQGHVEKPLPSSTCTQPPAHHVTNSCPQIEETEVSQSVEERHHDTLGAAESPDAASSLMAEPLLAEAESPHQSAEHAVVSSDNPDVTQSPHSEQETRDGGTSAHSSNMLEAADVDTMESEQLKREKLKLQVKVLRLKETYYSLQIARFLKFEPVAEP